MYIYAYMRQQRSFEKRLFSALPGQNSEKSVPYFIYCTKLPTRGRLRISRVKRRVFCQVSTLLLQCQKRPTTVSKETYYSVKRDLLQCQKRPTTVSKETYYSVKRDLLGFQQRQVKNLPIHRSLLAKSDLWIDLLKIGRSSPSKVPCLACTSIK